MVVWHSVLGGLRRALTPIGVGVGIGIVVAFVLGYFVSSPQDGYDVDGLGRALVASPLLARWFFGTEREWAGWQWFILDLVWFWAGLFVAFKISSFGASASQQKAPEPRRTMFYRKFHTWAAIAIALASAYGTVRSIELAIGTATHAGFGIVPRVVQVRSFVDYCRHLLAAETENREILVPQYDPDVIRDDFVKFLNDAYMEKVQKRAPRMVWKEGKVLHVISPSSLFMLEPGDFITEWQKGIARAQSVQRRDEADACLWGTVFRLFDAVQIHLLTSPPVRGEPWGDSVTAIPTDRRKIFAARGLHDDDTEGWYLLVPPLSFSQPENKLCEGVAPDPNAPLLRWKIEASFHSVQECQNGQTETRDLGASSAARAANELNELSKLRMDSPQEEQEEGTQDEWALALCNGLARAHQISAAVCVSTADPRLNPR